MAAARKRPAGRFGEDDESVALQKPGVGSKLPKAQAGIPKSPLPRSPVPRSPHKKSSLLPLEFSIYKFQAPISGVTYVHHEDSHNGEEDGNSISKLAEEGDWEGLILRESSRKVSLGDNQIRANQNSPPADLKNLLRQRLRYNQSTLPESPTEPESTTTTTQSDLNNEVAAPPLEATTPGTTGKSTKKKKTKKASTGKKRKKKTTSATGEPSSPSQSKKKGTKKKKKKKASANGEPKKQRPKKVPEPPAEEPPPREVEDDVPPSRGASNDVEPSNHSEYDDFGVDWDYSVVHAVDNLDTPVTTNSKRATVERTETERISNTSTHKPQPEEDRAVGSDEFHVVTDTEETPIEQEEQLKVTPQKSSTKSMFSKLWKKSGIKSFTR